LNRSFVVHRRAAVRPLIATSTEPHEFPFVLGGKAPIIRERSRAMTLMTKFLAGGAGLAALAMAAPASSQYPYGYNSYGYSNYGSASPYGYGYGIDTQTAANQCTAAVQNRLYTRTGLSGIIGQLLGAYGCSGRVLSITQVRPDRYGGVRVRGLASSGRYAYSPYGYGAYGALGYNYQADLSFRCDVDANGYVRNIDINRRY
jgi:hypothetical protein